MNLARPVCALLFAITLFTVLMYIPSFNKMVRSGWATFTGLFWKRS